MLQCKSGFRLLVATWFSTKLLFKKSVLTLFILSQKKSLRASIPWTFIYFGCWQSLKCLTKLTHENVSQDVERPFTPVLDVWITSPMTFLCLSLDHLLLYCLTFSYWFVRVDFQIAQQTELHSWESCLCIFTLSIKSNTTRESISHDGPGWQGQPSRSTAPPPSKGSGSNSIHAKHSSPCLALPWQIYT